MRNSTKLISLVLAVVLALSCFSVCAFAAEGETAAVKYGDVNKDGVVDVRDATLVQLYAAEDAQTKALFEDGTYDKAAADLNGDGQIDVRDATMIQLIAAGKDVPLPTTPDEPTTAPAEPTTAPAETTPDEPTTAPAEPTTAPAETTPDEPTTAPVEPTTEPVEPTTEPAEPTTEPAETTPDEPTTEPAPETAFVVVGSSNFVDCGWTADPAINVMTQNEDGTYSFTVKGVVAEEGKLYQTKVVEFPGPVWHGMDGTDLNVDFMLSADGDVTVTYNPETGAIDVTGETVIPPVYEINKIVAVGAGQNNFLNGIAWDPAAEKNEMTEVSEGVYEITFEDVEANLEYQVKFAANGTWDMNWGFDKNGEDVVFGQAMAAAYNGENIKFTPESLEDEITVKLTLDITAWDSMKKGGATYTIEIVDAAPATDDEPTTAPATDDEPTTAPVEPTTEPAEPTTAPVEPTEPTEPTTAPATADEPTTAPVEPTTAPVEPTTEPVEPTTAPATSDEPVETKTWTVAGSSTAIFGTDWTPTLEANDMTEQEDGTFAVTFKDVQPEVGVKFKVCANHSWGEAYGDNGDNFNFNVITACDVTITFNPETKEITVTGDGVGDIEFAVEYMTAAGVGQNNFLNGISWNPAAEENKMTEKDGVYSITFEECDATVISYQVKFAADGDWNKVGNWGTAKENAPEVVNGEWMDAVYDGGNIVFYPESAVEEINITVELDLSNYDPETKTGAKFRVTWVDVEE